MTIPALPTQKGMPPRDLAVTTYIFCARMGMSARSLTARIPARSETLFAAYDSERRGIADRYVQAQTIQNKKRLEAKTPEARQAAMDELRSTSADPDKHLGWVMNASLIAGLKALKSKEEA